MRPSLTSRKLSTEAWTTTKSRDLAGGGAGFVAMRHFNALIVVQAVPVTLDAWLELVLRIPGGARNLADLCRRNRGR